jgi:hypothetical protein
VGGIDSGLGSGGLAIIDRAGAGRVAASYSFVEPKGGLRAARERARALLEPLDGWGDVEFLTAHLRALAWMEAFGASLDRFEAEHGKVGILAVESFIDQHQHARRMMRNRWQTPFLMGLLTADLTRRGFSPEEGTLVYQDAGVILKQLSEELEEMKERSSKRPVLLDGDETITNAHERSAYAHAYALRLRLDNEEAS